MENKHEVASTILEYNFDGNSVKVKIEILESGRNFDAWAIDTADEDQRINLAPRVGFTSLEAAKTAIRKRYKDLLPKGYKIAWS